MTFEETRDNTTAIDANQSEADSREELTSDLEWDAHWATFDCELSDINAELQLAAEVEENYEHGDYRDELYKDELTIIAEDDGLDEHINMQSQHDNDRDLDFLDS